LRQLLITPYTLNKRYRPACVLFFRWLADQAITLAITTTGVDSQVAAYIEYLWEEGDGRNMAGDIISGLTFLCPHMKGNLCCSWQLFKAWSRQELPARAPPLPESWVLALACLACRRGWPDVAAFLVIAVYGCLRTTEGAALLVKLCSPSADRSTWVLELGLTKGGQRRGALESVVVVSPVACAMLKKVTDGRPKGTFILQRHVADLRKVLQSLLTELGLAHFGIQPYSLRRGGATHLFRETGSYSQVAEHGRWGHVNTAKVYINEGLATLNHLALTPLQDNIIGRLAMQLCRALAVPCPVPSTPQISAFTGAGS